MKMQVESIVKLCRLQVLLLQEDTKQVLSIALPRYGHFAVRFWSIQQRQIPHIAP